jgi:hypothetical protein
VKTSLSLRWIFQLVGLICHAALALPWIAEPIRAFIFLCAGSSSRFMFQEKFLYPLELKSNKTLLELLLDRLRRNLKKQDS